MTSASKNYAHLINLLKRRGFINIVQNQDLFIYDYGPTGTLLRQNILKQWWEIMVNQQSNVFPIEHNAVTTNSPETLHQDLLMKDFKSKYSQILKLTNYRFPFSIINVKPFDSVTEGGSHSDLKGFIFGGRNNTRLILQNFTIPSSRRNTFDFWLQLRLSWWKNYSNKPAHFHMNTNNGSNGDKSNSTGNGASWKCINIVYDFPWGTEVIERVHNLEDQPFMEISPSEQDIYKGVGNGSERCLPHCIVCETSLESAAAAWLVDSYHERPVSSSVQNSSQPNMVLKLHPQLCPYQISLAVASPSKSTELGHVCQHLERDFKRSGISVFNISEQGSSLGAHFKRNDQLGVQYTVIVMDNTTSDGLISIRHRDTQIQMTSHIGTVAEEMKRNLTAKLEH